MIVSHLKASVAKIKSGQNNAKMEKKVMNFYQFVWMYRPKGFATVSTNLGGPADY